MNKKTTPKPPDRFVVYIGEDDHYWHTIKQRLVSKYEKNVFEFKHYRLKNFFSYPSIFLELLRYRPSFVYIDFTYDTSKLLKLARLVQMENSFKAMPVVGLIDKPERIDDAVFAGVEVTHIKCGEYHDVIFDPYFLAFPAEAQKSEFARAKFQKDVTLISDFRIGYVSPKGIHAEGNIKLEEGSIIELTTNVPKNIIPSRKYRVSKVDDKNLFFNYIYNYELEFIYVDEPENQIEKTREEMVGASEEQIEAVLRTVKGRYEEEVATYEARLKKSKKDIKEWVIDKMGASRPKKTKVMIVDPELHFIGEMDKDLDQYPFAVRFQTKLCEEFTEIYKIRPDLIAMQFYDKEKLRIQMEKEFNKYTHDDGTPLSNEEVDEEKDKALTDLKRQAENKALDQLASLLSKIKSYEGYRPIIIIFNCENYDSANIQNSLKYPYIMANGREMQFETILEMASSFEKRTEQRFKDEISKKLLELRKKDPKKFGRMTEEDFIEKKFFVPSSSPFSRAHFRYPIQLKELTESEAAFFCDKFLEMEVYRLDFPVPMSLTLIPLNGTSREPADGGYLYNALIHSIGEVEKANLRKFINEIFFSDVNEKRKTEIEAFKALNEKEKIKRIEEEKAKEKEALAQEKNAKADANSEGPADKKDQDSDDGPLEGAS